MAEEEPVATIHHFACRCKRLYAILDSAESKSATPKQIRSIALAAKQQGFYFFSRKPSRCALCGAEVQLRDDAPIIDLSNRKN